MLVPGILAETPELFIVSLAPLFFLLSISFNLNANDASATYVDHDKSNDEIPVETQTQDIFEHIHRFRFDDKSKQFMASCQYEGGFFFKDRKYCMTGIERFPCDNQGRIHDSSGPLNFCVFVEDEEFHIQKDIRVLYELENPEQKDYLVGKFQTAIQCMKRHYKAYNIQLDLNITEAKGRDDRTLSVSERENLTPNMFRIPLGAALSKRPISSHRM